MKKFSKKKVTIPISIIHKNIHDVQNKLRSQQFNNTQIPNLLQHEDESPLTSRSQLNPPTCNLDRFLRLPMPNLIANVLSQIFAIEGDTTWVESRAITSRSGCNHPKRNFQQGVTGLIYE